jgi:hypothetical protein
MTDEGSEEQQKAQQAEEEFEQAKQTMKDLEEGDPPEKLEDWPSDQAKYETYGGPEGPHSYDEGPEQKLGPSSLRHHEDGDVSIEGDKVDDPDEYKGDPIPGGPTDPNAPDMGGEREKEKGGGSGGEGSGAQDAGSGSEK